MHADSTTFRDTPCIRIDSDGATALVALHGAHVLSWIPADGRERLFLSERAMFDGRTAIRGGIPVIFPQFSDRGLLPKHGFARTSPWTFAGIQGDAALFELVDDGSRDPVWPHPFAARLRIALDATRLTVALEIENTGEHAFAFTAALHTYLRVDGIAQVQVNGMDGCARWDAVTDTHSVQQGALRFAGEYDSVFQAAPGPLCLHESGAHTLTLEQSASCASTVVWNPGAALCARLPDMPADGYASMLCIEAAQIDTPVHLAPSAAWTGWQRLSVAPSNSTP